jgi:hypothetical protein
MNSGISEEKLNALARNLSVASARSISEVLESLPDAQVERLEKLIAFYKKRRENKLSKKKK